MEITNSKKSGIHGIEKWILVSSFFSLVLIAARVTITGNRAFIFLPWNLFLAFVPYALSSWLMSIPGWSRHKLKFAMAFIVWLLLIPNSFYILTDLFHLKFREESSRWFDLTLILSFAWNGLLLGILSVRHMEKIFMERFKLRQDLIFLIPVMGLNALGIYIGRFMRFNSWDVITNPFQLLGDIADMLFHPGNYIHAWGMIGCFSVFMTIIYISARHIGKAI